MRGLFVERICCRFGVLDIGQPTDQQFAGRLQPVNLPLLFAHNAAQLRRYLLLEGDFRFNVNQAIFGHGMYSGLATRMTGQTEKTRLTLLFLVGFGPTVESCYEHKDTHRARNTQPAASGPSTLSLLIHRCDA